MLRIFAYWIALLLSALASTAGATEIELRDKFHVAAPPMEPAESGWTWLTLGSPVKLQTISGEWKLLVDQVRFQDISVVVLTRGGKLIRTTYGAHQLDDNWALGGVLSFPVDQPGSEIRGLYIGFKGLDDPSLMRKVTAVTPSAAAARDAKWLLLMGVFSGLLLSAFAYNLIVYLGQRHTFQRWYLAWTAVIFAYGATWTNLAAFVFPGLAGPVAVRIDVVLVSAVIALGGMFLLSVLEQDKVPSSVRRAATGAALICGLTGLIACNEWVVSAAVGDILLNVGMVASLLSSVAVIAMAVARKSRVVWVYLIGWTPVILVLSARLLRNLGHSPQSDLLDYATFGVMGYESLVFSLLIAGRFAALRKQRDDAQKIARGMEIERETLHRAAHSDFLSGLGNRAAFHERMQELSSSGKAATLFLLDVDHLKDLNDRHGHGAGDALLQFMGQQLGKLGSANVHCARIGGDEFAILCDGAASDADQVQRKINELQGSLWAHGNSTDLLSLSVGRAASQAVLSPSDLFREADMALYQAKETGRGRIQAFDDRLRLQTQTKADLIREADVGLQNAEFLLHFQPIMDLRTGQLASVEALLRWNHPRHGMLTPGVFECALQDTSVGAAIQKRVLSLAIAWLRSNRLGMSSLAVNLMDMDLKGPGAARFLLDSLEAAGVPPSALCVEVTEGTILGRSGNETNVALRLLHEAGVRVALDDFGTGYASLVHLKEIPVDILKIDQSFIAGLLEEGDQSEEIVKAVLALGRGLGKVVVAEGVETLAQLNRLRELGCDLAQGYFLGRPSPNVPASQLLGVAA